MPPFKVYGLGSLGVNTDADAFDLNDRELRKSQNAITDQISGEGLISRPGFGPVTTVAAPGPVLGGVGVPLANQSIIGTHFFWIGRGPTT
jgi:hypothetical protein